MRTLHRCSIGLLLVASACVAHSEPPKVTSILPPGIMRGASAWLAIEGTGLTGTRVFVSGSAIEVGKLEPTQGGVRVRMTVGQGAAVGPHELRIASSAGVSSSVALWIGTLPQLAESEPNDDDSHRMSVPSTPETIYGRIGRPGDTDYFEFDGKAGERWVVDCVATAIGSSLSPRFEVRDATGEVATRAEIVRGRDPRALITLPRDGTYSVKLSDANGNGGPQDTYLLTIARAPVVQDFTPHAERPGRTVGLVIRGANLGGTSRAKVTVPRDARAAVWLSVPTARGPSLPFLFPISDEPAIGITESDQTMALPSIPAALEGKLEVNPFARFYFDVEAGEHLQFSLLTRSIGSKLEGMLQVSGPENAAHAPERSAPDIVGVDEVLSFTANSKGRYVVEIRSKGGKTGQDLTYRLEVQKEEPGFDATIEKSDLQIRAGESLRIPIDIRRFGGFAGAVSVTALGLPKGARLKARAATSAASHVDLELSFDRAAPREPFLLRLSATGRVSGKVVDHAVRPAGRVGPLPHELIPVVVISPAQPGQR